MRKQPANKGPANRIESSPTGYGFVPASAEKEQKKNNRKSQ
ncbi:hypothetical protein [Bacillus sp. FJAT-27445]|nr:hypothetical protein [Bacillus sp. FJAT-27445]